MWRSVVVLAWPSSDRVGRCARRGSSPAWARRFSWPRPYLIWQAAHGWPQLTVAANIGGSAEGGRAGFIPFQLVMVSPVLVPVWVAGLVTPLRRADLRLRFIPVTYLVLAVAYLVGNGRRTTWPACTRCF